MMSTSAVDDASMTTELTSPGSTRPARTGAGPAPMTNSAWGRSVSGTRTENPPPASTDPRSANETTSSVEGSIGVPAGSDTVPVTVLSGIAGWSSSPPPVFEHEASESARSERRTTTPVAVFMGPPPAGLSVSGGTPAPGSGRRVPPRVLAKQTNPCLEGAGRARGPLARGRPRETSARAVPKGQT